MSAERVLLAHGSGGRLSHDLVRRIFVARFGNPTLAQLDDAARCEVDGVRLAFTTDSYVVKPLFFRGGDIGRLAVCGTVNDLSMLGACPRWLSAAFVVEEGLPIADLERIVASMQAAAVEAGVTIVTGDTKVVERGGADGLFITTAGVGLLREGVDVSGHNALPGDKVIVSGSVGDHGIAVLSAREGLTFGTELTSDVAPLNHLVETMLAAGQIHVLRDPTRGGLGTTLNEIAEQSGVAIWLDETMLPVRDGVRAACEMLGYDPLYVANEGKLVATVPADMAENVLSAMRRSPQGLEASIVGEVREGTIGRVTMRTSVGGTRVVDMLAGELLPRIC
ncbi:MAG: hydrogenase expression/formation protein HypE [Chloroflexota bacterium]